MLIFKIAFIHLMQPLISKNINAALLVNYRFSYPYIFY